jgi:3-oxoacyl-[acyl-carrier protein] reductase
MDLHLKNKNALVCGSTQGIGKATAILLAKEGVNVTLIARNEEKLKAVLSELETITMSSYFAVDSKPEELKRVIENLIYSFIF